MNHAICIDDDIITRKLNVLILSSKGYKTYEAQNGAEALKILKENPQINLAILDLNMEVMDGYQFLAEIASMREFDDLEIIVTSSEAREDFMKNVKEKRIDIFNVIEYLKKPFELPRLRQLCSPVSHS